MEGDAFFRQMNRRRALCRKVKGLMKFRGNLRWFLVVSLMAVVAGMMAAPVGMAQSPSGPAVAPPPGDAPKFDAADNAWVLISSALVLLMTAPALAMFYAGLVRKKNVLNVMMQCVFLMCLMTVVWAVYGYTLVFGGTAAWIGDGRYLFMRGVNAEWTSHGIRGAPLSRSDDPGDDPHAVSRHVFHHYPGADLRGLCGTDAV